jgi:hypothetical protein
MDVADPISDEGQIEARFEMTATMVRGNQGIEGNGNGRGEVARLDRTTEHKENPQP